MADGVGANSTGKPVLYLPTPDPTMIDITADPHCRWFEMPAHPV